MPSARRFCQLRRHVRRLAVVLLMFGPVAVAPAAAAEECPQPPPAVRDLDIPRFYSDAKGTVVDKALLARHDKALEPLKLFLQTVVSNADKSVRRPSAKSQGDAAACAIGWIRTWARDGAWLGRMAQPQAEYQRKWDLAGVALAYLKVRRFATPEDTAIIDPWLIKWADAARGFFDTPERKRNNHWYWLGVGMAATALATDSPRHWESARGIMADASRDISADGLLPMELERGPRALYYHVFSTMPVVVLAELGAAKGEDWYALGDGAAHRLVATTFAGLKDPARFVALAGVAQEDDPNTRAGWLQLYAQRFPDRVPWEKDWPEVKPGHRWIGGDALVLAQTLRAWTPR
jgi:poly(beta-D-mannuronate) lyase